MGEGEKEGETDVSQESSRFEYHLSRIGPKRDCWGQKVGQSIVIDLKSEIARGFFSSLADTTFTMPDSQCINPAENSQSEHQEL